MARKIKSGYEWPFKKRKFDGHEIATSQTVNGLWYAYIDGKFVHKVTFTSETDAFNWMKYYIRKNEE